MQPEEVVIADLIRERDEARDQVRSLTEQVEAAKLRDARTGAAYDALEAEHDKCAATVHSLTEQLAERERMVTRLLAGCAEGRRQAHALTETVATKDAQWRSLAEHFEQARRDVAVLREAVRSLTVERDAERERGDRHNVTIGRVGADLAVVLGQLSRAREALGSFDENPPPYRAGHLVEGGWRIHQARALAALRVALAEPLGGP